MTVKQLIEKLTLYPGNMDVYMSERQTEFKYGLLNSVYLKEIVVTEDPNLADEDDEEENPKARVEVIILDEE